MLNYKVTLMKCINAEVSHATEMKSKTEQVHIMQEGFSFQLHVSVIYHLLQEAVLFMQIEKSFCLPIFIFVHLIKTLQGDTDQKQFYQTKTVPSPTLALMRN